MKCKYEVIDNFLDEEYFDSLMSLFDNKKEGKGYVPWYYSSNIAEWGDGDALTSFYMFHLIYEQNVPTSPLYDKFIPLCEKLEVRCLIRMKANLYPKTHKLYEHPMHKDTNYSSFGAIFSLNTCDGYTKLKDGTKIDSIANRILLFNASEEHCSTTTTNVPARFNININYIQEQKL